MIKQLLKNVEVEWKPLGEVAEIANNMRKPVKASLRVAGDIPYYGANNIQDYVEGFTHDGEFVLIAEDGTNSLSNYSIQWAEGKFWANNHVHVVRGLEKLDSKFLLHFLRSIDFIPFLAGGDRAKLTKGKMVEIPIPIPPITIQKEIVRILDAFTALTKELTKELTARKKQYNYYRDNLLSFQQGDVEWKTLAEVANIYDGTHQTPKYKESGVPFISVENIKNIYASKKFISSEDFLKYKIKPKKNDIFMTRIGDIGTCSIVKEDLDLAYYVTLALIRINVSSVIPKFIIYVIESKIGKLELYKRTLINAVPIKINLGDIGKIKIPIPPLAEQERIVAILDKFDALTTSISDGLPREIALRQKQYEYYRDLLLNFPKPDAA